MPHSDITDVQNTLIPIYKEQLLLPDEVIAGGKQLITQLEENNHTHSRCHYTIVAAAMQISCQQNQVARRTQEFVNVTDPEKDGAEISVKQVNRRIKKIKDRFDIKTFPLQIEDFLEYYLTKMELPEGTQEQARALLDTAKRHELINGPAPSSVAAGVIDAANRLTNNDIYMKTIQEKTQVSEPQIRKYSEKVTTPVQ